MHLDPKERLIFISALAVLAWFYGYTTRAKEWFPTGLLVRAQRQARALTSSQSLFAAPGWTEPAVFDTSGAQIRESGTSHQGLTLIASYWKDAGWSPGLKLINQDGNVLHEWRIDPDGIFADSLDRAGEQEVSLSRRHIHGFHLFPDGDVLVNIEYAGTARLDACSNVKWRLPIGSHHSISPNADGSFWVSTRSRETQISNVDHSLPASGLSQALSQGYIFLDRITKISPGGEILKEISLLPLLYENGLQRHIAKGTKSGHSVADPLHLNDVESLPPSIADSYPVFTEGDLLVSLRNLDLVFVFDPDTGRIKWHASHPFIQQHDPDFLGGGRIGIFDNNADGTPRGELAGGSRIVVIKPSSGETEIIYPRPDSTNFYSSYMGQWQQLQNGNLLLTESTTGRILEVTPRGSVTWSWIQKRYKNDWVPWVTGSNRYQVPSSEVNTWPCSPDKETTSENE